MILCIVGPTCAGKTTSSKYISSNKDIEYVEASDYVRQYFSDMDDREKSRDRSNEEEGLTELVSDKFEERGKAFFAKMVWEDIRDVNSDQILISGFRTVEEVEYIRSVNSSVICVGIHSDSRTRYQRYLEREEESKKTYKEFIQKDFIEYEFGIAGLLSSKCDFIIMNDGPMEHLYEEVDGKIIAPYIE
ncbi:AAA family ATPase [Natrinema sp. LN54]|uniref:AAA family ATPase n=1 Tax=Natrinema sp. LN54 TaxID=3458705 RepID=UPI004036E42A